VKKTRESVKRKENEQGKGGSKKYELGSIREHGK
jgi:hypothetical protein